MTFPLDEGDTGEALLKTATDAVKANREYRAGVAFGVPADAVDAHAEAVATAAVSGLPEYLDDMRWQLAYWEWGARFGRRKRVWRSGWDHWSLELSVDEYSRRTLVIGPWVIALWGCRCEDCKAEERDLLALLDADEEAS